MNLYQCTSSVVNPCKMQPFYHHALNYGDYNVSDAQIREPGYIPLSNAKAFEVAHFIDDILPMYL